MPLPSSKATPLFLFIARKESSERLSGQGHKTYAGLLVEAIAGRLNGQPQMQEINLLIEKITLINVGLARDYFGR